MSECWRESAVAPQPSLSPLGLPPLPHHLHLLLLLLLCLLLLNQRLVHLTNVKPTTQLEIHEVKRMLIISTGYILESSKGQWLMVAK